MSIQTMRAYTWEMLKGISRDDSLSTTEKNHFIKICLNDCAKRYFQFSTAQSLKDVNLKKLDWKSLILDEDFRNYLKRARSKKYLNMPVYRPNRHFKPLTSEDGKFNFESYEDAEDAVVDHVFESRLSGFVRGVMSGKNSEYSGDTNVMEYVLRERAILYYSDVEEVKIDECELENQKENIRQMLYELVLNIQTTFNLPDGWQLFIIGCILNPRLVGGNLKIFHDVSESISVEKVDRKSLNLRIDKGVGKSDLAIMLEVFQVFLDYDIPAELLPSTTDSNILARKLAKNKDLTHNMLAKKVYRDEYLEEDAIDSSYAYHTKTNSKITKKIYRAKNRNLEYSHKVLSGRKINEILSRED